MKLLRINSLIVLLFLACQLNAQLFEENFDYSLGVLTSVSADWSESPTGSTDIDVVSGNLSYTGYPSSGIGHMIFVDGGVLRSGVTHSYSTISQIGQVVYFSFLLHLTNVDDLDNNTSEGDYFCNLQSVSGTMRRSQIYIRQGSSENTYSIGQAKVSTTNLHWIDQDLSINTTYLVVASYSFLDGTDNDVVRLWLNPSLDGTEPTPDLEYLSGSDVDELDKFQIRQRPLSGNIYIDGIRLATSWDNAPLPVELISFTAMQYKHRVKLEWTTATEVNNYGFGIEKLFVGQAISLSEKTDRISNSWYPLQGGKRNWHSIGFIPGHGNSNSPKHYSYIDPQPVCGRNQYRLKQIDLNGNYEYSQVIEVNVPGVEQVHVLRNYPNPFNPATNISFNLYEASPVKLVLYDVLGNELAVIKDENYNEGEVNILLNFNQINKSLPSGVYLLNIESEGLNSTLKLIYTK